MCVAVIVTALFPYISATDDALRVQHFSTDKHSQQTDKHSKTENLLKLYEVIDDVKNICEEKRDLDRQSRLHRILHGWLFAHVPLSFALIILSVVHAVMALRF